ncbi:MAG TPA: VOC family protein [Terriglobales bacterium]|nr:VOC family protein [Terriglobales bacterium]
MTTNTFAGPKVNGVLETSLYVSSVARSLEFYQRVFGFPLLDASDAEVTDQTRLAVLRAGDRDVLLLFKRGGSSDTDATGSIHVAFAIARPDLDRWEDWLRQLDLPIEKRMTWKFGGQALYFRDPDGHLLEVVTPGVWPIY